MTRRVQFLALFPKPMQARVPPIRFFGARNLALAALAVAAVHAEVPFVELAGVTGPNEPVEVFAGTKPEFALTLTTVEAPQPSLRADLVAVNGTLAAPLAVDFRPELRRQASARAGLQRFVFSVEIPAVERRQRLLMRLKVQSAPSAEWRPLPAIALDAVPCAWKESLRRFAARIPSGLVSGGERLASVFVQAGLSVPEVDADSLAADGRVRVWFAEPAGEHAEMSAGPHAVIVVFKPGVRGGLAVTRSTSTICVAVEDSVLARLESEPLAQDALERALAVAAAVLPDQEFQP